MEGQTKERTTCCRLGEARWDAAGDLSFPRISCWGAGAWLLAWSCLLAFPCGLLESFHTWLVMPNIQNVPVQKEVRQPGQETARTAGRRAQLSWARVLKCRSQFSRREEDRPCGSLVQTIKRSPVQHHGCFFGALPRRVRTARGVAYRFRRYACARSSVGRRFQGRIPNFRQAELPGKRSPLWVLEIHDGFMLGKFHSCMELMVIVYI
jgi:hypothetical protein